jgi:EAL domain-containing protein (putative c-di-GMP-specific phosphodiesterase class I)
MQPVVSLLDASVRRVEALARLRAADGSLVMPGVFLPLLGDAELDRLLRMVLEQSLAWLRRWDSEGLELEVAVNLAPTTLVHPQCAEWVEQALRASSVAPTRLTLELLETQELDRAAQSRAIAALAALGVKLAIDDLGSGYSSLKRLTELPFDTIKVDQSLTLNLRRSPMLSFNLVGTLIRMGAELGRHVIVEGAQDADTVDAVRELGATLAQGFALARPMPAAELHAWWAQGGPHLGRERIHGPLGALALHWALAQDSAQALGAVGDCPVTPWLHSAGLRGHEVETWHASLHLAPAAWSPEQPFVRWLLQQLQGGESSGARESAAPGTA